MHAFIPFRMSDATWWRVPWLLY